MLALILYRTLPGIMSETIVNPDVVKPIKDFEQSSPTTRQPLSRQKDFRVLLPQPPEVKDKPVRIAKGKNFGGETRKRNLVTSQTTDGGSENYLNSTKINNPFLIKKIPDGAFGSSPLKNAQLEVNQSILKSSVKQKEMSNFNRQDFNFASNLNQKEFLTDRTTIEKEGRVLLRKLEHGSGPFIEIAWPVSSGQRKLLYRLFRNCYGMEVAVINSDGELFRLNETKGEPWSPNLDRYSSFFRKPAGSLTVQEYERLNQIRKVHGQFNGANHVRIFSRQTDAMLLGGLKSLIGDEYQEGSVVRAYYRTENGTVIVENIQLDGELVQGQIYLPRVERHCDNNVL